MKTEPTSGTNTFVLSFDLSLLSRMYTHTRLIKTIRPPSSNTYSKLVRGCRIKVPRSVLSITVPVSDEQCGYGLQKTTIEKCWSCSMKSGKLSQTLKLLPSVSLPNTFSNLQTKFQTDSTTQVEYPWHKVGVFLRTDGRIEVSKNGPSHEPRRFHWENLQNSRTQAICVNLAF